MKTRSLTDFFVTGVLEFTTREAYPLYQSSGRIQITVMEARLVHHMGVRLQTPKRFHKEDAVLGV